MEFIGKTFNKLLRGHAGIKNKNETLADCWNLCLKNYCLCLFALSQLTTIVMTNVTILNTVFRS